MFCPVPEEAVPPGEGCGGGQAGHQAPLPEEGHQQGRLQGDPQEVRQPGMSPYISKFAKHLDRWNLVSIHRGASNLSIRTCTVKASALHSDRFLPYTSLCCALAVPKWDSKVQHENGPQTDTCTF